MNPYALLSLLAAFICLLVANFIFYYNPKNSLNRLIALLSLLIGFLAFVEFSYRQAETLQTAFFWISVSGLWPFVPALLLNIGLLFSSKFNSIKNNLKILIYVLVYFPAVIFSYLFIFSNSLLGPPMMEFYGWTYSIGSIPILFGLMSIWTISYAFIAAYILFTYYTSSKDFMKRKEAKYIFIGLYLPLIVSLISDIIFPLFWMRIPELTMTSITVGLVFMAYGTWKYQFPLLTPSLAAEKIINTMSNILIILDHKKRIVRINTAGLALLGYDEDLVYGKFFNEIVENGENPLNDGNYYSKNEVNTFEILIKTFDGHKVPVAMAFSSFQIREDEPLGTICIGSDLTEEIKMREALYDSEELYRTLVRTNPDSVLKTDLTGEIIYVSPQTLQMHGYQEKDELMGRSVLEIFAPECRDLANQNLDKTLKEGLTKNIEYNLLRKDGSKFRGELNTAIIMDIKNHPLSMIISIRDITHHKETEEKLQSSLDEKEILLKEIHHRVKNNLQIISSLLNLQSNFINDEKSVELFKESQNRIKSMAMIHEGLYQSKDLAHIDFGSYIKRLVDSLFSSYLVYPEAIEANLEIDDMILDVNTSIPLGLIVNEMISNSIKHAFPDGRSGKISITLTSNEGKSVLIVSDDGIGFPDDLDPWNTSTLGMQLINSLTKQINGEIELINREGTVYRISFKS